MPKLLREHEVAEHFRKAMRASSNPVVAVPFWGKGAIDTLGFTEERPVRILCNLDHPGCNPEVIAEIRELGFKVKTHPRLHAKIYATDRAAIVGSSNVSTNGLTVEGAASRGWIEANAFSEEPSFVREVYAFFEALWTDPETRLISNAEIRKAIEARKSWPSNWGTNPPASRTLLAACRERPDAFQHVYVAAYDENLSDRASKLMRSVKSGAQPAVPGLAVSEFRNAWGFQFEKVPEGAWLISLNCRRKDKPHFDGCAKATGLHLKIARESDLTIALRGVVPAPGSSARLPISAAEKESLTSNAHRFLRKDRLVPIADVIKVIDSRKRN